MSNRRAVDVARRPPYLPTRPQEARAVEGEIPVAVADDIANDPAVHLREGEEVPPRDKTKQRIGRYVETALVEDAELRRVVNASIELAQKVKHNPTPTRRQAGVAAASVIMLANILRRLHENPE